MEVRQPFPLQRGLEGGEGEEAGVSRMKEQVEGARQ